MGQRWAARSTSVPRRLGGTTKCALMTPASHVRPRTCRAEPSSPRQRPRRHRRKENLAKISLQVYLCIMSEEITPNNVREIDASALKGLAHPQRMAIYDALTNHGPQTATS